MAHTNRGRVILGGLLAGVVINVVEYIANGVLMKEAWGQAMQALGKPTGFTTGAIVASVSQAYRTRLPHRYNPLKVGTVLLRNTPDRLQSKQRLQLQFL